ncbi:NAD(P)H-binding protein [Jannaschia sp. S6380]|uniref:NAD(P)-dependent oxidoreductase n=1 Tax=Jannaschia sp. S6380 TaxID=2926408 RepID=UPI001FF6BB6A|nr:NAD(P)H-binding protein [Jannaschia sp. S6380]MCK0167540.1 NAD(P)H-binding protein [Jannaschia sp. S6380]
MHILVYGADGATGRRIVRQALDRGHRVRASVLRHDRDAMQAADLEWTETDILNPGAPERDMADVDVVLNAVGIHAASRAAWSPPPLHSDGTRNILTAMRGAGVDRLITISASFVRTMARGPIWFELAARMALSTIVADMARMEGILREAGDIRWTAVRPGWLLDEGPSGDFEIFADVIPRHLIRTRTGDLAAFMLRCAEEDLHIRETPAIARAEPAEASGPRAVLAAMRRGS